MTYAEPNNVTGLYDMIVYADSVTGGWVSLGILISLYLIVNIYLIFSGESMTNSMVVSGWLISVIGTFFMLMGVITAPYWITCLVMLAIPLVWTYLQNE